MNYDIKCSKFPLLADTHTCSRLWYSLSENVAKSFRDANFGLTLYILVDLLPTFPKTNQLIRSLPVCEVWSRLQTPDQP